MDTENSPIIIESETQLLAFLIDKYKNRNVAKTILKERNVSVNGVISTQFNLILLPGFEIEINPKKKNNTQKPKGLKIIFEDKYLLVINKEAGLLSIATDKPNEPTAYNSLSTYVKAEDPVNKIFVVHRLDRDTSGLMIYAKSLEVQKKLQTSWNENILERSYLAVTEGSPKTPKGTMKSYLVENKALIMYSTQNHETGQFAITHFEVLKKSRNLCLLKIDLETGRKNQIRVHMKDLGIPVVGDSKYGAKTNPLKRLGLHAWVLSFKHPFSGETLRFETEIPSTFSKFF